MNFTLLEKLAVLKAIDEVMMVDNHTDIGEIAYLSQILGQFNLEINVLNDVRKMNSDIAKNILQEMTQDKKAVLYFMMKEMAEADGQIDTEELEVIFSILQISGAIK